MTSEEKADRDEVLWRFDDDPAAGCLPEAIVDPSTCKVAPSLEGTWLAKSLPLQQCVHGDVEDGPGTLRSAARDDKGP